MKRTVKTHSDRKREIIETAEDLINRYGYEDTTVERIINQVGIAKGTFYHYFRSKDDLLDHLVDGLIEEVTENIREITDQEGDAVVKLFSLSAYFHTLAVGKEKFADYLHEERNAHIHMKIEKRVTPPLVECYVKLIDQGNREGIFRVNYVRDTALAMLGAAQTLSEGQHDHADREKIDLKKATAVVEIYERMLGARKGLLMDYMMKQRRDR